MDYVFDSICLTSHNQLWHGMSSSTANSGLILGVHERTPSLGRDANMKELRFHAADGVWRFAFAFDPKRMAIILCGGDKSGGSQTRFYKRLIAKADERFDAHLAALRRAETAKRRSKNRKTGS